MKWQLTAERKVEGHSVPACLSQRSPNPEAFKTSYLGASYVTDVLKEELMTRLNTKLFPKDSSFELPGWRERHAKDIGYIRALKEVIELLP